VCDFLERNDERRLKSSVMKAKKDMNSTRQMNPHLERRELDSRGLMNTENHYLYILQGFSQINLHIGMRVVPESEKLAR